MTESSNDGWISYEETIQRVMQLERCDRETAEILMEEFKEEHPEACRDEGWLLYDKKERPAGAPTPLGDDGVPLFCNRCGRNWDDVSSLLCGEGDQCICDKCIAVLKEQIAVEAKGEKQ